MMGRLAWILSGWEVEVEGWEGGRAPLGRRVVVGMVMVFSFLVYVKGRCRRWGRKDGRSQLTRWQLPTWEAVLRRAFLQDAGGIGDEGVEVEQLVHVLPALCWRLALLRHRDGVWVVHLDGHVVRHVTGTLPWHLKVVHVKRRQYVLRGRRVHNDWKTFSDIITTKWKTKLPS